MFDNLDNHISFCPLDFPDSERHGLPIRYVSGLRVTCQYIETNNHAGRHGDSRSNLFTAGQVGRPVPFAPIPPPMAPGSMDCPGPSS